MADLRSDFLGIRSPNPFWLASAPPTDKDARTRLERVDVDISKLPGPLSYTETA